MMRRAAAASVSAMLAGIAAAMACGGSRSTNFDASGGRGGDGGTGGVAAGGSSAGGTSAGGQGGSGAASGAPSGGSSMGGASSGGNGAGASGGTTGGDAGSAGNAAGGGVAGSNAGGAGNAGGGAGGRDQGGAGGRAGAGQGGAGSAGAPVQCYPDADAMDVCGPRGASCLCCPTGGPTQACICTTQCTEDEDCEDPSRPDCNIDPRFTERGICAPSGFTCLWGAR
jgi:hypothetical protein